MVFQQSRKSTLPIRKESSKKPPLRTSSTEEALTSSPQETSVTPPTNSKANRIDAVVIGTSTGGPIALKELIPKLPNTLGIPIFVVQHMPPRYTQTLAMRIGEVSQIPVYEAADGMKVEPNHVYIAAGGSHMGLGKRLGDVVIRTSDDPPEHNCRPAVDFTLRAACQIYAGNVLGVILTGMGRDGTEGCRLLKQNGGTVLAQHPEGCIVYGMPKVVVEERLADRVVTIDKMASWIVRLIDKSRN